MKQKKKQKPWVLNTKKWLKRIAYTSGLMFVIGTASLAGVVFVQLQKLPDIDANHLNTFGSSRILDKNNDTIWQSTEVISKPIVREDIPRLYEETLLATEDANFYKNHGFSYKALANAVYSSVRSKVDKSFSARGGSTIDQQLIKNTYYDGGRATSTLTRKIGELFLAKQLDENFSKDDILTFYVNKLEFAENAVGISAAMDIYFGKEPKDYAQKTPENIIQIAYLAGLGQSPTTYNLYTNPQAGVNRTLTVLSIMRDKGIITKDEYEEAKELDLLDGLKPRFHTQERIRQQNIKYKTYTDAVKSELTSLGYDYNKATLTVKSFLDPKKFDDIRNTTLNMKYLDQNQQVAVSVIDKDGIVVGMVGSRYNDELNRATQQTRSSGSSLKPFTAYGPLFEYFGNQYSTATIMSTAPYQYPGSNAVMYNWGRLSYGDRTLQDSLRLSLNTPVGRIDDGILGSARMKTFLHGLGLDIQDTYSSVDGIGLNISTLQAASAYNALINGGIYTKPRFIDKITFIDRSVRTIEPKRNRAMNESTAYLLTQMLRGIPQDNSTAPLAKISNYKGYGGKTGTVAFDANVRPPAPYGQGGSDAWYDSFTKDGYAISIWTGYDKPNTSPQIPDTYKEFTRLGSTLQTMLNGNKSIANWDKPNNVRHLGGSDLNAHYQVTDAHDIGTSLLIIPQLSAFPNISTIKEETKAEKDWRKNLGTSESMYKLWQKRSDIVNQYGIIDEELYKVVTGNEDKPKE